MSNSLLRSAVLFDICISVECDEEATPNLLITIMVRDPLTITVPVPWNMFVDGKVWGGGCVCEVAWLTC